MRYLVNMVYKCKGKSYLTYEVEAESEDEAIELAKVGEIISADEFFDDVGRTAMVFEGFGDLPSTVRFGLNFVAHLNMDLFFLLTL